MPSIEMYILYLMIFFYAYEVLIPFITHKVFKRGFVTGDMDECIDYSFKRANQQAWRAVGGATGGKNRQLRRIQEEIDEGISTNLLKNISPYLTFLGLDDLLDDVENPQAVLEIVAQNMHRFPNAWNFIANLISGRVVKQPKEENKASTEGW